LVILKVPNLRDEIKNWGWEGKLGDGFIILDFLKKFLDLINDFFSS